MSDSNSKIEYTSHDGCRLRVVGIVPARYQSSRFPGKPLALINGKPMVIWTLEAAAKALGKKNVYAATDNLKIKETVEKYGFHSVETSLKAPTGTDRLHEVTMSLEADIYINIQGDEPMVDPSSIIEVIKAKISNQSMVINGMCPLRHDENVENTDIPKVVTNKDNILLYISRSVLPGAKSSTTKPAAYMKQVCIYAFTKKELDAFADHGKCYLEMAEDIEILRFLYIGLPVLMVSFRSATHAVDRPEDIPLVESLLAKRINA